MSCLDSTTSGLFGGSGLVLVFKRQAPIHRTALVGTCEPVRSQRALSSIQPLLA
jgi:hypothetical protein